MWKIPNNVYKLLQYFTGEILPYKPGRNNKRMFLDEFDKNDMDLLLQWFNNNKVLIISDILRGRGEFCAEWVLVIQKTDSTRWVLKNINAVMNHYFDNGKVEISPRGSLKIGKITMQRKGGDGGRETANMLQFKLDPTEIFSIK